MTIFPRAWKQFLGLKILKFFDEDPDPRSGIFFLPGIQDGNIRIRDKHPGFATLYL
jgi:hypothetical protein